MNLFIDTTNEKYVKIATFEDTMHNFHETEVTHEKNLAEIFVQIVKEHLEKYELVIQDIKKIYLIKGPGTFTGVKIGTVFANTLKQTLEDIELFEMNSCDIRYNLQTEVIAIDAKSNMSYATIYHDGEKSPLRLLKNEDLEHFCNKYHIKLNKDYHYQTNNALVYNLDYFEPTDRVIPLYVKKAI